MLLLLGRLQLRQENLHNIAALFVEFVVKIKIPADCADSSRSSLVLDVKPSVKTG